MIKRISIYQLPEGADRDAFWKYHKEEETEIVKRIAGPRLKKYVINRVIGSSVLAPGRTEEPKFFDIVETWWENEEIMNEAYKDFGEVKVASGKNMLDDFMSKVSWGEAAKVEEYVAKDIT